MKKRILTLALTVIFVLNFAGVANAAENQAKFNFTGTGFQLILNILSNYYIESGTSVEWKESSEKTESEYWNEGGSIQTATNDSLMDINLFLDSEKNVTTIQTGFVLDEKAYEVNISKAEQVVEIEIVNEYVHGNIRLTKVDAEYPDNKLTGATFEVYKDTNENGKIDDGDELIGNLEETETGIYEMKELLYGKYIVRETKAPEGFLLDKGEYSVFIEKDETTYSVENKAGVGFINEAMRGTLKIVKTSSDGKVKGFAFRVTGANGYDMTFETDKNGEIVIEGLRIGEYTVSEVANNASAAYITPADQNVTIKLDETAVVKMHNELRDTPKTGDDTNMKLWYVLAGLSAVGIAVTSVVAHKKKKKEGNE